MQIYHTAILLVAVCLPKKGTFSATPQDATLSGLVKQKEKASSVYMPCGSLQTIWEKKNVIPEEIWLESKGFRTKEKYPNSHICEWTFMFPGKQARLSCPDFQLTSFLCLDHVIVGDGSAVQNHYCGNQGPLNLTVTNKLWMRFSTSAFLPGVGFRCNLIYIPDNLHDDEDEESFTVMKEHHPCACGINNLGTKVVNGTEVKPGEVPWQAALVRLGESVPFCGGSLINDQYVLTAAHCVVGRTPYNLEILLNFEKNLVGHEGYFPERFSVQQIIPHRNYSAALDYDAALIKLSKSVSLTNTPPICLPTKEQLTNEFVGVDATVTGWGYTMEDGEISTALRKASVEVWSNGKCREKYAKITDRMLCASSPGRDSCQGDSGGPLFYESDPSLKKHTQIGIVSWGVGCARPDRPGVYARVTELVSWIHKMTTDAKYCGNIKPEFNQIFNSDADKQ